MTHSSGGDRGVQDGEPSGVPVSEIFRRALPPIRAVLGEYRVAGETGAAVETDLAAWLLRYARRNPDASDDAKILALVSLACSFGRGYQARSAGFPGDRKMEALLAENPEAVAVRVCASFGVGTSMAPPRSDLWSRMRALARLGAGPREDDE
ncbi:MAG: hypothetical protein ABJC07_01400 [Acidobacteriota bacterium]